MGYGMYVESASFSIPSDCVDDAFRAIMTLMWDPSVDSLNSSVSPSDCNTFSWMHHAEPETWDGIQDAMDAWRWPVEMDRDGHVTDISFTGQKIGDDTLLFDRIAPYVFDGSYIEMRGEDGAEWIWMFHGDRCWRADPV